MTDFKRKMRTKRPVELTELFFHRYLEEEKKFFLRKKKHSITKSNKDVSTRRTIISSPCKDIEAQKDLSEFKIAKEMNKGVGRAIADSIILEPNFSGIGFSFNKLKDYLK